MKASPRPQEWHQEGMKNVELYPRQFGGTLDQWLHNKHLQQLHQLQGELCQEKISQL